MKRLSAFSTLIGALTLASAAQAGTISYNFNNPLADTEFTQTGSVNLFDTTLGRLTGVSFIFNGAMTTTISLANLSNTNQRASAKSTMDLYYHSDLAGLDALLNTGNPVLSLSTDSRPVDGTIAARTTFVDSKSAMGQSAPWSPNGMDTLLASFQGQEGQKFNLSCKSDSGLTVIGGGGQIAATQANQGSCGASVTYTYDNNKVPEPASLALFGLAASTACLAGRRRRAKA